MANLSSVASEVFDILRSYDYVIQMYDEDANTVFEPEEARRFFGSKTKTTNKVENLLVAVIDENDDSVVRLIIGPSSNVNALEGLRETLRTTATKYNMIYDLETSEEEIQPKGFATKASVREGKETMTQLIETKLYGTSRSSYARFENARAIFRHTQRVDEENPGSRTKNIGKIFIENADGERYLMPVNNVAAGLAMGQHVSQGGNWADPIASKIEDMGGYFTDLGSAMSYLGSPDVAVMESACNLRGKCKSRRKAIRESLRRLANESTYTAEAERFRHINDTPLLEGNDLESLRESISVEGKKLSERVLNACARLVAEGDFEAQDEILDERLDGLERDSKYGWEPKGDRDTERGDGEMVRVMGRQISKSAWEALKRGHIELSAPIDTSQNPQFKNTLAQIMFKVGQIAEVVQDHSLAALLSAVYDDYSDDTRFARNPELRREATILGIEVCRAARVPIDLREGIDLGPRGVTAILEMEDWFRSFSPNKVLIENPLNLLGPILKAAGFTENGPFGRIWDKDGLTVRTNGASWTARDPEGNVKTGNSSGDLKSFLGFLRENTAVNMAHVDDIEDQEGEELSEELTDEDVIFPGKGENEFTAADEIDDNEFEIIPGDTPGMDLAKEVMAKPEDDEDINRMISLAGLNRSLP